MIRFSIYLQLEPGRDENLARLFEREFAPAISSMEGFKGCRLLRPYDADTREELGESDPWYDLQIELMFDSEEQRRAWVKSDEHDKVWPRIESLTTRREHLGFVVVSATTSDGHNDVVSRDRNENH